MFAKKQFRFLLALLAFFATVGVARAVQGPPAPFPSGTTDGSALVGAVATPSVAIDFGIAGYDFFTLDIQVDYDPLKLSFNPAASFLDLHPGLTLTGDNHVPGSYTANYGDFSDPTANLAGLQSFAGAFTVLPGLAPGASSSVNLGFSFGNTNFQVDTVSASFQVTRPIPEPENWVLLLGGLVAIVAVQRRRLPAKSV